MRRLGILLALLAAAPAHADVSIVVDATVDRRPISPLIYGVDSDLTDRAPRPGMVRLGGNRWTAYNWETNASNAGSDWCWDNDAFFGPSDEQGAAVLSRVAPAAAKGAASLVTVPIVDWVAADKVSGGGAGPNEGCPGDIRKSANYLETRLNDNNHTAPFALTDPVDKTDDDVYQDQFLHWLKGVAPAGAQLLFSLDNEPDLWPDTHAAVHPSDVTYAELIARSVDYAKAIKRVWPGASVFGPVSFGYSGFENLKDAPDAAGRNFIEFYLQQMASASATAGQRLVDQLDLHWYPEATGGGERVTAGDTSAASVEARVQAPRSLWDPNYVEASWITTDYQPGQPINLLPKMFGRIAAHNPGTGLSFTEWNYGASHHISGAIATADVLGIFGRHGVSSAAYFPFLDEDSSYAMAAFRAFRDYDGQGRGFGDTSVRATTSDVVGSSVYASVDAEDPTRLVVVAINKTASAQPAALDLKSDVSSVAVYRLTAAAPVLQAAPVLARPTSDTLPPHSVSVLVFRSSHPFTTTPGPSTGGGGPAPGGLTPRFGTAHAGKPSVRGARVTIPVTCTGPAGSTCRVAARLSSRRRGGRTLGSRTAVVTAPQRKHLIVALGRAGRRAMGRRRRFAVSLQIQQRDPGQPVRKVLDRRVTLRANR